MGGCASCVESRKITTVPKNEFAHIVVATKPAIAVHRIRPIDKPTTDSSVGAKLGI